MLRGDKHKTGWREGRSLTFMTDWLMTRAPRRCSWTKKSESARQKLDESYNLKKCEPPPGSRFFIAAL
ncbi:hypothetical protein D1970_05585 [Mesobacillus zeae]|uniref:Uncharacterized protein n=1 Tax=Mesobacillus zeae TaxID=1917180 RepID=A0A398BGI5_9BACI|nr:hypothetical protein D1970_05585 [Mesobacillus zeae]